MALPNRKFTTGATLQQYWLLLARYWQPVLAPVLAFQHWPSTESNTGPLLATCNDSSVIIIYLA